MHTRLTDVVVVGAGFAGLGQAIQLEKAGIRNYVLLEKAQEVGGTWRDNSYPGCACDVESHLYSYSYAQNPDWPRSFASQPDILRYLKQVSHTYRLRSKIHFGTEITGARWDPDTSNWRVSTTSGADFVCRFLVFAVGGLHVPRPPELPGLAAFRGPAWHSSRWRHDVDLAGKRVAVIGTGASAIQIVPHVAAKAAGLSLFQRTAPWVLPKPDPEVPRRLRTAFRYVPGLLRYYRYRIYWRREKRALAFNGLLTAWEAPQQLARAHIARHIDDPALREKLTPHYTMGCKRILFSNDYYPTLAKEHVAVVTSGVAEVRAHSVVDGAGREHPVDAIVYATGFRISDALDYLDIVGPGGRSLAEEWAATGMRAHLGISVPGFPNMFFLLGPNTAITHSSVVFMLEAQARYITKAIRAVAAHGATALEARRDVHERFQAAIQAKLSGGVWARGGCANWYHDAQGVNRAVWPGFTWQYWWATRRVRRGDYRFSSASNAAPPAAERHGSPGRTRLPRRRRRPLSKEGPSSGPPGGRDA